MLASFVSACLHEQQKHSEPMKCGTAGNLSFYHMAQGVVHALKGLACRVTVLLAHAEVTKDDMFSKGSKT